MEVTLKTDFRDALRALEKVPDIFAQQKVTQSALRASMKPMLISAKAHAEKTSGALAESLKLRTFRRGRNLGPNIARVVIQSRIRDKKAVNLLLNYYGLELSRIRSGVKHAHLIEFGTKRAPARPFLRPAFDSGIQPMIALFRQKLGAGARRELNKIARVKR